jgi:hypothetical protein
MIKGILAISGQSGLFKMLSEAKNSIIVESLETQKKMPVYSTSKVSSLEDIAIFTEKGDMPLKEVFKAIYEKENGGEAISHKSSANELKSYFEKIVPDFDKDRVYVSDIKKVLLWYNLLREKEMLDFSEEEKPEAEDASSE